MYNGEGGSVKKKLSVLLLAILFVALICLASYSLYMQSKLSNEIAQLKSEFEAERLKLHEEIKNCSKKEFSAEDAEQIIAARADEVVTALKNIDLVALSSFIHPYKGVRFSPYSYVNVEKDLVFTASSIKEMFSNTKTYPWGVFDGSGLPIEMTFKEYFGRFVYDKDFKNAETISYNTLIGKGNMVNNLKEVYSGCIFVEYYFSRFNPAYDGMDWESLRIVFEEFEGTWYVVGIQHDQWTI